MRIKTEIPITLNEAARALGLSAKQQKTINSIVTDSREAGYADLFVALRGKSSDGEVYVAEAKENGAFILSSSDQTADLYVNDTYEALLKIASMYKKRLNIKKTIAITGSVGKTTTKNILSSLLSNSCKLHATKDNYNNILGVAHTLLSTPKNSDVLIIEAGMNHRGELAQISRAISPDLAIITNIGYAHVGNLGNREAIAEAKREILLGMNNPYAVIPYAEPLLTCIQNKYTFSTNGLGADCVITPRELHSDHTLYDLHTRHFSSVRLRTNHTGEHILTALAASVSAMECIGFSEKEILRMLPFADNSETRGKLIELQGYYIFDDTYSSSPEAVIADMKMLALRKGDRSCMLGDMLELGERSKELHEMIGREAVKYGFRRIYAFGKNAHQIANGARLGGMRDEMIFINTDLDAPHVTANQIKSTCNAGETILFKASHAIRAERIIDHLKSNGESNA